MNKLTGSAILLILLYSCAVFFLGWKCRPSGAGEVQVKTDTLVLWKRDTAVLVKEVPVTRIVEKLKIVKDTVEREQYANNIADSSMVSSPGDSAVVEIPITQRTYEGENYRAVVQGFRPELVYIDVKQQTVAVKEIEKKRWSFTVGPQVGYGFTPAGWQPYAGVGITAGYSF